MEESKGMRRLAQKRIESGKTDAPRKSGGSAGRANQYQHTRLVGADPLVKHAVLNPSRVQPKTPAPEADTLRPTGWRGLKQRGHA